MFPTTSFLGGVTLGKDTDTKWAKQLLAELADGLEADAVDGYLAGEDRPSTVVEPKPRATGLTLDEIVADHLDYSTTRRFSWCRRRSRWPPIGRCGSGCSTTRRQSNR
jgi:hypothetical protein